MSHGTSEHRKGCAAWVLLARRKILLAVVGFYSLSRSSSCSRELVLAAVNVLSLRLIVISCWSHLAGQKLLWVAL